MSFEQEFDNVIRWEGVYDFDPDDAGGETCFGITRKYQPEWIGWPIVEDLLKADVPKASWAQQSKLMSAVRFYYASQWNRYRMDEYPQALQGMVFGGIVNQGPRVVRWLQECLTDLCQPVEKDGVAGNQTFEAIPKVQLNSLVDKLWKKRAQAYIVSARKPNQSKFLLGWLNRLEGGA